MGVGCRRAPDQMCVGPCGSRSGDRERCCDTDGKPARGMCGFQLRTDLLPAWSVRCVSHVGIGFSWRDVRRCKYAPIRSGIL